MGKIKKSPIAIPKDLRETDEKGILWYVNILADHFAGIYKPADGYVFKRKDNSDDARRVGLLVCYHGWTGGFQVEVASSASDPASGTLEVSRASKSYRFGLVLFGIVLCLTAGYMMWNDSGEASSLPAMLLLGCVAGLPFLLLGNYGAKFAARLCGKNGHEFGDDELLKVRAGVESVFEKYGD